MIIFLGIAGSGKGTQAELLSKNTGLPCISTGQLLRDHKKEDAITKKLSAGILVDDDVVLPLLEKELEKQESDKKNVILDGFPRDMRQAQWLVQQINQGKLKLKGVFHLKVSKEVAMERLLGRKRHDDNELAINKRFAEYDERILPIINYFQQQGILVQQINGDQKPEKVAADIQKDLGL